MENTNANFLMHKFKGTVKLTLILGCIALLAACGSQIDDINGATGVTAKTSTQSIILTNSNDIKLLASLATTYPNGQLPADLQAAASAQLAQNPAALKLSSVQMVNAQMSNAQAYYQPSATTAAVYKPVYRIQNTTLAGSYFFSIYETEGSTALDTNLGWNYEGPAFEASLVQGDGLSPVWRFRNKVNGSYLYTIFESERAALASTYAATFEYEGVAWYGSQTPAAGLNPLFRFRNLTNGTYLFSAYETEKAAIVANFANIFEYEGISYYVKPASAPAPFASKLPDTGSATCGKNGGYFTSTPVQNSVDCSDPEALSASTNQDGMIGHDVTNPLNLDGKLGFSYSNVAGFGKTDCVKDNITGLVWEGKPTSGYRADRGYTYYGDGRGGDISEYVAQVNAAALCGKTDWRIPTVNELQGLLDYGVLQSATKYAGSPMIDTRWFPNTITGEYWSSTPASSITNVDKTFIEAGKTWVVSFWGGGIGTASANYSSNRARLVSGSIPVAATRYSISADGKEVTDSKTGLIWRRCMEGRVWDAGLAKCKLDTINFPSNAYVAADIADIVPIWFQDDAARIYAKTQTGWRIPNIKELKSIHEGTFDRTVFPQTTVGKTSKFQSSTIDVRTYSPEYDDFRRNYSSKQQVWFVDFDAGWVYRSEAQYNSQVRLVR